MTGSTWSRPEDAVGILIGANPVEFEKKRFFQTDKITIFPVNMLREPTRSPRTAFDIFYAIHLHRMAVGPDIECVRNLGLNYNQNNPKACFYGLHFLRVFSLH